MNTFREVRNGYVITEEIKKLWNVEIELLQKLLSVCNKYDLKVYADGGTLLGAIREHGFIPWDDDIDVCMFRHDYDKLLEISEKEFFHPYFLQSAYSDKGYCRGHAQLRKDNTAAIVKEDIFCKFHQGIFIDIFVYDAIPDDKETLSELRRKALDKKHKMEQYCYEYSFRGWIKHPIANIMLIPFVLGVWFKGMDYQFSKYDALFKAFTIKDNSQVGAISFSFDRNVRHNLRSDFFKQTCWVDFEDIKIPVPYKYHEMLTCMYGDYLKPSKAPSLHNGFATMSTENSYKLYLPGLKKKHITNQIHSIVANLLKH